jgi:hypothetical protein
MSFGRAFLVGSFPGLAPRKGRAQGSSRLQDVLSSQVAAVARPLIAEAAHSTPTVRTASDRQSDGS